MDLDTLPGLVAAFVSGRARGAELLDAFRRHVARVSQPYPDAYFALGRKTPDAVDDLANRAFATCARVAKGRFPFCGRTPFAAYTEERMEGRAIRYHSFYAKISITREILRADYAHNLSSHPLLRWRADLYERLGQVLPRVATRDERGHAASARWRRAPRGPAIQLDADDLVGFLRRLRTSDVEVLACAALERGGPQSRAQLTHVLEEALGGPPTEVADEDVRPDTLTVARVREAVVAAYTRLGEDERILFRCLAKGMAYDEIVASYPQFRHKVDVNRRLERASGTFRDALESALGGEASRAAKPAQVAEAILEVLAEVDPTFHAEDSP